MAVAKCKSCGVLFQQISVPFCPECASKMEDEYKIVREYVYEHPSATIEEVTTETGVEEWEIIYFLKDERLSIVNATGLLRCEQCGKPIKSGRFCEGCMNLFGSKLNAGIQQMQGSSQQGLRMHTYGNSGLPKKDK